MRAAVGVFGVLLWAQQLPDSVALAQSYWLAKVGVSLPPDGPEVLAQKVSGDTFYAWVRFWEGPGLVEWRWGRDTYRTVVFVPALPPDSLMPLADFSVPPSSASTEETADFPWEGFWIAVAVLLLLLLVGPFIGRGLRGGLEQLRVRLRWWLFLWRWRPRPGGDLRAFIQAVKALLRPQATFHPGALTPREAQNIQGPPALCQTLCRLLEIEYEMDFAGKVLPPEQCQAEWSSAWQSLRQAAPGLRQTFDRLTL